MEGSSFLPFFPADCPAFPALGPQTFAPDDSPWQSRVQAGPVSRPRVAAGVEVLFHKMPGNVAGHADDD